MNADPVGASILVPVLNEESHIESSIRAMLEQGFERGVEVLVIDGGSQDGTRGIIERLGRSDERVRIFSNPQRRTPQGLNIGLRNARGEYVARMDAHTYYPPDYIARAVQRFEQGGVECVSGPQVPYGEGTWSRRIALALRTKLGMGGASFRNAKRETECDTAFTGVWRRALLLELGGWDERWPVNQDAELAARIREAGGKIVSIPDMAARYVPRDSLSALARQYWRYGQYRAKTAHHHAGGMRKSHVLPPGAVISLAGAALTRGRTNRLARLGVLLYGIALGSATASTAASEEASLADLASLPLVLATMHLSWGAGFLVGCVRFGPPTGALARQTGMARSGSAS